jgi:hypothetical protein
LSHPTPIVLCWPIVFEIHNRIPTSATMERQRAKTYTRAPLLSSFAKFPPSSSSVNGYARVTPKALNQPKHFKHSHKNPLPSKTRNFLSLSHRSRHPKMSAIAPSSQKRTHSGGDDDLSAKKPKTGLYLLITQIKLMSYLHGAQLSLD